jgi:hypothetical protein
MKINGRIAFLPIALAAVVLGACTGGPGSTVGTSPSTTPSSEGSEGEESMAPSIPSGEVPDDLLADVLAQAADRAGVDVSEARIATAEAVTWSDGSLGCPEPGMAYTQALVPGYRVVVEAGGEELHFHGAESGDFRFCDDPQPPLEGPVDR